MVGARPRVDLPARAPERLLRLLALAALGVMAVALAWAWPRLPATIPMHFNLRGDPDGWGERAWILVVPAVALVVFALMTAIERMMVRAPHDPTFNYPWAITEANAERQYRFVWRLLLGLKLVFVIEFALVLVQIVAVALGSRARLSPWTMAPVFIFTPVVLATYFVASYRAR